MDTADRPLIAEDVAVARQIVSRHDLPEFVAGFDVETGEVFDEPALWIVFHIRKAAPIGPIERKSQSEALRKMIQSVHPDLLSGIHSRYPYYRFDDVEGA